MRICRESHEIALAAKLRVFVTRDELLTDVWKQPFAGSNKVGAVVRTLRKKLNNYSSVIETVTGHGYRFGAWSTERGKMRASADR